MTTRRALPLLERQRYVDVEPDVLFGTPSWVGEAPFDRLVLVVSHDDAGIDVRPIDPTEVAGRMASSLAYERLDFTGFYLKFRFAFPGKSSGLVEAAPGIERERLLQLLAGKPAYLVAHPYPVSLTALREAMAPLCR